MNSIQRSFLVGSITGFVCFLIGAISTMTLMKEEPVQNLTIIRAQEFQRGYSQAKSDIADGITDGTLSRCILEGTEK